MAKPNIVVIVIDSLRADHLGCYGYGRDTSPCIDRIAAQSVVFDSAFAAGIPTMPSFTTLLSGVHPYRHGITAHAGEKRVTKELVLLPQMLQRAGYTTIGIDNLAVQSNGRGSWFARGFDYYSGFLYKPFSDQSAQLVDRANNFLDEYGSDPFFLYLHLWDPHSPYGPPPPYDTLHYSGAADPAAPTLAEVTARAPDYYAEFLADMNLRVKDDYGYIVAQYDGEISYVDAQVGRLAAHLQKLGVWEDTLFVVQSDHGECFGEGGVYFDHHGLYDAVIRIALLMKMPGGVGGRCGAMISTEDMVPTLAEVCGFELPGYPLTGVSFARALEGRTMAGRDMVVCTESTRQATIALRTPKWKLVQPIAGDSNGQALPDIYGEARRVAPQLFDLEADPRELRDVAALYPQVCDEMAVRLQLWREEEVMRRGGSDPLLEGLSLPYDDFMARLGARKLRG